MFMASVIFAEKNHDSHEHHGHAVHQNDVYVDGNKFKLDKKRFDEFKKNLKDVQVAIINVQGMVCDFCARGIEKAFLKDTKVKKIDVDLENGKVVIAYSLNKKIEFPRWISPGLSNRNAKIVMTLHPNNIGAK